MGEKETDIVECSFVAHVVFSARLPTIRIDIVEIFKVVNNRYMLSL